MSIIVKFRKMDNLSEVSIPVDNLSAHIYGEETPIPLSVLDKQEEEMPSSVSVTYIDYNYDYNQNTQTSKTVTGNVGIVNNIPIPIAMDANQARSLADLIKFEIFAKRMKNIKFFLGNEYSYLEPTDVIQVPLGNDIIEIRITKKDQVGGLMEFDAERHYRFIYTQDGIGGEPLGYQEEIIPFTSDSIFYFLDIPILRDIDDDYGAYVAMSSFDENWRGANLYHSIDNGVSYFIGATQTVNFENGIVLNAIPSWEGGNQYDTNSYIDIILNSGELENETLLNFLDGQNSCVIGDVGRWEVISFLNAELIGTRKYRLTNLLRGRKGTEQNISNHLAGDKFVFIDIAAWGRVFRGDNKINQNVNYKPTTFGQTIFEALLYTQKNEGNGLKPYSPVHGHYGFDGSGNRLIKWLRRTRIDGGWTDGSDVSLGEISLVFSIDFVDNTDTVIRTVNDIDEEEYLYTDYATDFPSGNARAIVYQISERVGRGFPLEIELD